MKDFRRVVWYVAIWFTTLVVMSLMVRAVASSRSGFSALAAFSVFSAPSWFLEALLGLYLTLFPVAVLAVVHVWGNGLLVRSFAAKKTRQFFVAASAFQMLLAALPVFFMGASSLLEIGRGGSLTGSLPLCLATLLAGAANVRLWLQEGDVQRRTVRVVGLCLVATVATGLLVSCFVQPRFAEGTWRGRVITLPVWATVKVQLKPQGNGGMRIHLADKEPTQYQVVWGQHGRHVYIWEDLHAGQASPSKTGKGRLLARGTFSPDAVTLYIRPVDSAIVLATSHSWRAQ